MRDIGLFIDLDGVMADFDGAYLSHFGYQLDRTQVDPPGFWQNVQSVPGFYRNLPVLPDATRLWNGVTTMHQNPIILTGIARSIPSCEQEKREWVAEYIGARAAETMICCFSKDKCLYGRPGDVLLDDWLRYRANWENMGGVFVHHRNAGMSLARVQAILNCETHMQVEILRPLVSGRNDNPPEPLARRMVNQHGMEI